MAQEMSEIITAAQCRKLQGLLRLTITEIADGSGLSNAYVSEFKNGHRNMTADQKKSLRQFFESQCELKGEVFPGESSDELNQEGFEQLGNVLKKLNRPALLIIWA